VNLGYTEGDLNNGIMLCPGDVVFTNYKITPNTYKKEIDVCPKKSECSFAVVINAKDTKETTQNPAFKKRLKHDVEVDVMYYLFGQKTELKLAPLEWRTKSFAPIDGHGPMAARISPLSFIIPYDEVQEFLQGKRSGTRPLVETCFVGQGQGQYGNDKEFFSAFHFEFNKALENMEMAQALYLAALQSIHSREQARLRAPTKDQLYGF